MNLMQIAVLEDESILSDYLHALLTKIGHDVTVFSDGLQLTKVLNKQQFDLYILDWNVPKLTGMDVLKYIRHELAGTQPVIFLTSNQDEIDVVAALQAGADDYCIKPVRPQELLARINALSRRAYPEVVNTFPHEIRGYVFDDATRTVSFDGQSVVISEKEFDLAYYFFTNFDSPLSRKQLLIKVWGKEHTDFSREVTRTLDVHVTFIRRKLKIGADADKIRLVSIHSFGYRLVEIT
jgi:two-component system response regulator RegX3